MIKFLALLIEGDTQTPAILAVGKRLRQLGHRVINLNPAGHRDNEMYGGNHIMIAAPLAVTRYERVLLDYKDVRLPSTVLGKPGPVVGMRIEIMPPDMPVQDFVDRLLDGAPQETVNATLGLPDAPMHTANPADVVEGLPVVPGEDAGPGLPDPPPQAEPEPPKEVVRPIASVQDSIALSDAGGSPIIRSKSRK